MQTQAKLLRELKLIRHLLCLILVVLVVHFDFFTPEQAIMLGGAILFLGILWLLVMRPVLKAYNAPEQPDPAPAPDANTK